ncbi:MAG TPA: DMT family transporter [Roseiarcus sp.]|jgi:drug/metabolite transporter (DMT)-like permease|nr:DMT family transporter [Roseiarcus sp.]
MRILAIGLMCATMVCFTGLDTSAKWLSASLPITQITWTRYIGASLIALAGSRALSRPVTLRSKRPWLQLVRSTLLFGSTSANLLAVHQLQLSETATISFLTPIFVALLAGPLLGEKVSPERMVAIAIGFLGVLTRRAPGRPRFNQLSSLRLPASLAIPDMCWPRASWQEWTQRRLRSPGRRSPGSWF